MKTTVVIARPQAVYHPGDKISGVVKVSTTSSTNIEKVVISLHGEIHTHIVFVKFWHAQSNFNKRVKLFERSRAVFEGPYTLKQGDHEWPFELVIPHTCDQDESQVFFDKKSSIFDDDPQQDLPPAVEQVISKNFNTSGNTFTITYPLTASVLVDKLIGSKQDDTTINLNIQPWRETDHSEWRPVTQVCKFQAYINNGSASSKQKPSLFRRMSSNHQNQPNFEFALSAKVATTIIAGQPVPAFLTLQHDDPLSVGRGPGFTSNTPQFKITSISGILSTDNVVRSQGSQQELYLSGSPESLWNETLPFASKLAMPVAIENGSTLDIRSLIPDFWVSASETPSFASFSACRIHEMKIKVELECNNQSFTATFSTKRSVLLPPQYRGERGSGEVSTKRDTEYYSMPPEEPAPPPSFGEAFNDGEALPGYSRNETY